MKKPSDAPVLVRSGSFDILKVNVLEGEWRDLYYWLLTLRWPSFAVCLLGIYLVINVFFATLYYLGRGCIDGMPPGSFVSAFFFSVETLATVGYGHMYPATIYGHVVATAEIITGMAGIAVMTGLIFVRFSRPTARLLFSRVLLVSPFDGQPALMMRVANQRRQPMAEAEFRLMMIRHEPTVEDPSMHRFHALPLQVDRLIMFPAALTIRHLIDESSPLHGMTPEMYERTDIRFMASVMCLDKVLQAPVQSDQSYNWRDVRFGEQFVEMYRDDARGRLVADYARLHDTEPARTSVLAPGG